jgi:hypothetical protein
MTSHETAIAERLHEAAERIAVDTDLGHLADLDPTTIVRQGPSRRPTSVVGVAVGVAVSAAVVAVAVVVASDRPTVEVRPTQTTAPADDPAAPVHGAHVASPPAWFGTPQGGVQPGGSRSGRWVSMAIGRRSAGAVSDPIVVSAFDGAYRPLDDAETVTIGGVPLRSVRLGDWQTLATDGTPTVMVHGSVDERTLAAVLDAVEVTGPSGEFSLRLRSRPARYAEIVAPRVLGPDIQSRRSLASETGGVRGTGINDLSDSTDPLLAAAASGSDLRAVDLGGTTGWVGGTTNHPVGPLRFLVWSPRPGVVFEITTGDTRRTDGDLVDLALATSVLDPDDWDDLYGE